MARQSGIITLQGSVGNLSMYKTSLDGHLARQKGGVDAKRIQTDPAFARTRENGAEFGRAGQSGKLLRDAFRALLNNTSDSRMVGRLIKVLTAVIKTDGISARGERNLSNGDLTLLAGFDFNTKGKINRTFFAPYTLGIDRPGQMVTLDIAPFVPTDMIAYPEGATHFQLVAATAVIDFATGTYSVRNTASPSTELSAVPQLGINLQMPAAEAGDLFVVLGIEFTQMVNDVAYTLNNGAYNALAIVGIDPA